MMISGKVLVWSGVQIGSWEFLLGIPNCFTREVSCDGIRVGMDGRPGPGFAQIGKFAKGTDEFAVLAREDICIRAS